MALAERCCLKHRDHALALQLSGLYASGRPCVAMVWPRSWVGATARAAGAVGLWVLGAGCVRPIEGRTRCC